MTQTIIDNIIQNMLPHLNSIQLKKLKEILSNELSGKVITDNKILSSLLILAPLPFA